MKFRLAALALVLLGSLRIAATWDEFTQTYDEPFHIACGLEWWAEKQYTRERQHPPLARIAVGAGPFLAGARPQGQQGNPEEGEAILHEGGGYWRRLRLARMGTLPFYWLACFAVWALGRRLYGDPAGLAGLAVFSLLPPVLGHAGLATTDMAALATFAFAVDRAHAWFARPVWWRLLPAGLAAGLALASKFSNVLYLTIAFALLLFLHRRGWRLLWALPIALLVLSATYRFKKEYPDGRTPPLAANASLQDTARHLGSRIYNLRAFFVPALRGIEEVREHNREGHSSFLLGHAYVGGDWRFFPVALALKTPLAALILFLLGLRRVTLFPALLLLLLLAVLLPVNINLGIRHALQLYLPIALVAGWTIVHRSRWLTVPLTAWLIVASVLAHPHYLSAFNELAQPVPERYLAESDLDWGQDLPSLVRIMDREGIAICRLHYFGTADVGRLYPGRFYGGPLWEDETKGCTAVSVRLLSLDTDLALQRGNGDPWRWLRGRRPLARAGNSIAVYNVPEGR